MPNAAPESTRISQAESAVLRSTVQTRRHAPASITALAVTAAALLFSPAAWAHKASDAYLTLAVHGAEIEQRWDIALRDLDRELDLDTDHNGELRWGEVRQRWTDIDTLAGSALDLRTDGKPCTPGRIGAAQIEPHSDGNHAVLMRRWQCAAPVQSLQVAYRLFADSDPTHRGILRVTGAPAAAGADATTLHTAVLVPGAPASVLSLGPAGAAREASAAAAPSGFFGFVAEGVHHILIGTDHVLFLLALLLPAVLVLPGRAGAGIGHADAGNRANDHPAADSGGAGLAFALHRTVLAPQSAAGGAGGAALDLAGAGAMHRWRLARWRAAPLLRGVLGDVLRVVTAFTLAHSVTLALAVFDVLDPPSRWVESVIAASVLFAALNNLVPMVREGRWRLTFAFGLVHGFGFAGALKDLGLGSAGLVSPLLGFNLGVELGQLGLVGLFLPLAWALRGSRFYRQGLLRGGSMAIALVALVWLVERTFDVALIGL